MFTIHSIVSIIKKKKHNKFILPKFAKRKITKRNETKRNMAVFL